MNAIEYASLVSIIVESIVLSVAMITVGIGVLEAALAYFSAAAAYYYTIDRILKDR